MSSTSTHHPTRTTSTFRQHAHPEWGPAGHHPENHPQHARTPEAVAAWLDLRDRSGERPDDN